MFPEWLKRDGGFPVKITGYDSGTKAHDWTLQIIEPDGSMVDDTRGISGGGLFELNGEQVPDDAYIFARWAGLDAAGMSVFMCAKGGVGLSIKWGKATATWTTGNTVTLTPCVGQEDNTATGEANITAYIISPYNATPRPVISSGNILAYMVFLDSTGAEKAILFPVPQQPELPAGTGQRKVLQLNNVDAPFWGYVEST